MTVDSPPAVPAPNARPTTATQKADLALYRLDQLERALAAGDTVIVHGSSVDVGPKVVALDDDLNALTEAFNALAAKVEELPAGVARSSTSTVPFDEDAQAAYDSLRGALDETNRKLVELDKGIETNLAGDVDVLKQAVVKLGELGGKLTDEQVEHDKDIIHLRQEIGSLSRAVEKMIKRFEQGTPGTPLEPRRVTAGLARPAVLRLMRKVVEIGKGSQAPASAGGFKFRGIEAVMDAIGSAMRHEDVGLILETKVLDKEIDRSEGGGRMWTSVVLTMRYTFVHPEDGSEHSFEMVGEGRDMGDKAASKAASMAAKYGLCQALMIPFTNMADSDAEDPASQRQTEEEHWNARLIREQAEQQRAVEKQAAAHVDRQESVTHAQRQQQENDAPVPPSDEPPWDPEDEKRAMHQKLEKALAARRAIDAIGEVFPPERAARLEAIENHAKHLGIDTIVIEGQTIAVRIRAARATLGG